MEISVNPQRKYLYAAHTGQDQSPAGMCSRLCCNWNFCRCRKNLDKKEFLPYTFINNYIIDENGQG